MKKFIAALAFATVIASPAFAATKKVVKKTTTTTTTSDAAPTTAARAPEATHRTGEPLWSADLGLGTAASKFHFGLGLKGQLPVTVDGNDFKFGLRSGFYLGPSDPTTWIIPILATSEYDFRVNNALKPYVGIELGISITHYSANTGGLNIPGASGTSTDFAFLFNPGVNFGDYQKWFFELPLGTIASSFVILPSIGYHFN